MREASFSSLQTKPIQSTLLMWCPSFRRGEERRGEERRTSCRSKWKGKPGGRAPQLGLPRRRRRPWPSTSSAGCTKPGEATTWVEFITSPLPPTQYLFSRVLKRSRLSWVWTRLPVCSWLISPLHQA
jgi:hypothetical protein